MTEPHRPGSPRRPSRRITDAELHAAIAGLREGLTDDAAAERAGMTGRALRYRLQALGLTASELQPKAPDPATLDPHERRRRLAALASERKWERDRAQGRYAWGRQTGRKRRDLHLLLTPKAWDAIHAEAARRQCSMSSLVADALFEAGIIPEA